MAETPENQVRGILTVDDITELVERLLLTLCEMERQRQETTFTVDNVYVGMDFLGYNLGLAMPVVVEDNILPQQLVIVNGNNISLTDKGRRRCQQIRQMKDWEWHETLKRLDKRMHPPS